MRNNIDDGMQKILPIKFGRYIVIDTETTGSSPNDHIIEIAAVEVRNGKLTGNQFNGFIKPRVKINTRAIQVHHMNDGFYGRNYEMFEDDSKEILISFLAFVKESLIFAHNANFDSTMLNRELKYWNLKPINIERFRCTVKIFKNTIKDNNQRASLVKCCEYFNIEKNDKLFHSALYDTIMCAKVLIMLFDYKEFLKYKENIKKSTNKSYLISKNDSNINSRILNEERKELILRENVNIDSDTINLNAYTPQKKPCTQEYKVIKNNQSLTNDNQEEAFSLPSEEISFLLGSELKHLFKSEYKVNINENNFLRGVEHDQMIIDYS